MHGKNQIRVKRHIFLQFHYPLGVRWREYKEIIETSASMRRYWSYFKSYLPLWSYRMFYIMPLSIQSGFLSQCILLWHNYPSSVWQNCHSLTVRPTVKVLWKSVTPTATLIYTFSIPFMDLIVISQCSCFPASSPAERKRQYRCILNCLGLTFGPSYFPLLNFSTTGILHEIWGLLTWGINYSHVIYSFWGGLFPLFRDKRVLISFPVSALYRDVVAWTAVKRVNQKTVKFSLFSGIRQ